MLFLRQRFRGGKVREYDAVLLYIRALFPDVQSKLNYQAGHFFLRSADGSVAEENAELDRPKPDKTFFQNVMVRNS